MTFKKINIATLFFIITLGTTFAVANTIQDTMITTAIKAALAEEKDIPVQDIEVTTIDKVVKLKGTLDTKLQAHRAVEIASSVDNVIDVVDTELQVRDSSSALTDSLITAKVKGKIRHLYIHKKIDSNYDLHVETNNQVVHIFGEVGRTADISTIVAEAKKVVNVKSVKTNIRVKK